MIKTNKIRLMRIGNLKFDVGRYKPQLKYYIWKLELYYNPLRILPYTNAVIHYPKYDHVVLNSTYAKAMKYANAYKC